MKRSQFVLMAMAARPRGARFDSMRIQKLLFLIDREARAHVGGPHFDFQPYLYGPFDKAVFDEIDALRRTGETGLHGTGPHRAYILTESGHERGAAVLNELAEPVRRYVANVARWVLSLSFGELLVRDLSPLPGHGGQQHRSRSDGAFPERGESAAPVVIPFRHGASL